MLVGNHPLHPTPISFAPPSPPQQRMLAHYELYHTLGKGMSGKVKLGRDTRDGCPVAVKLMYKDKITPRAAQQLNREVQALQSLCHPHILELRDAYPSLPYTKKNGQRRDVVALVLELASSGELFEFVMHTGSFDEPVARTFFAQLAEAMVQCHAIGVSHRDLKPENVLLDENFQLKIADFGLASINEDGSSMCRTKCGTSSYMAPEVLDARAAYDGKKADVWSAGVILFIMLAGNPPFEQAASSDWWYTACKSGRHDRFWAAHLRTCPNFPPLAQDLLNRIFVENPSKRASFQEITGHPWLQGETWGTEEMRLHMLRRREMVQARRLKERQAHIRRRQAQSPLTVIPDPFARRVVRSVGSSDDLLYSALAKTTVHPPQVPDICMHSVGTLHSGLNPAALIEALAAAFSSCTLPALDSEQQPLPSDENTNHDRSGTEDSANADKSSATKTDDASSFDAPVITVKADKAKVKARFVEREVEISAQVYADSKPGGLLIDILRIEGDAWKFDNIRRVLEAILEERGAIYSKIDNSAELPSGYDVFIDGSSDPAVLDTFDVNSVPNTPPLSEGEQQLDASDAVDYEEFSEPDLL